MKTVTIYSTPTCTYCKQAKELLKEKNVAFTEVNVAADKEQLAHMRDISGQMGVPVITVDEDVMIGYDRNALLETLGLEVA